MATRVINIIRNKNLVISSSVGGGNIGARSDPYDVRVTEDNKVMCIVNGIIRVTETL